MISPWAQHSLLPPDPGNTRGDLHPWVVGSCWTATPIETYESNLTISPCKGEHWKIFKRKHHLEVFNGMQNDRSFQLPKMLFRKKHTMQVHLRHVVVPLQRGRPHREKGAPLVPSCFIHAWFRLNHHFLRLGILEKNNYITVSMFPGNKTKKWYAWKNLILGTHLCWKLNNICFKQTIFLVFDGVFCCHAFTCLSFPTSSAIFNLVSFPPGLELSGVTWSRGNMFHLTVFLRLWGSWNLSFSSTNLGCRMKKTPFNNKMTAWDTRKTYVYIYIFIFKDI